MSSIGFNKNILNPEVQVYIKKHRSDDPRLVSLGKSPFSGVSPGELATQIKGWQTAAAKLPAWAETTGIYFPPSLNLEQASSEALARYKAGLIQGRTLMDLTGGFGVDSYFFSKRFEKVHYCERNPDLAAIAAHNFRQLGAPNVRVHTGDGMDLLEKIRAEGEAIDWIYLDPSRRGKGGKRVFRLSDCEPPVVELLPRLFAAANNILLKTAPMLDVTEGIQQLGKVREVHVAGIRNEVKELLWKLGKDRLEAPEILAVDLGFPFQPLRFTAQEESESEAPLAMPMRYLYEPNACILKAGAFKTTAVQYGLFKLHPSTHLYTSDTLVAFPGRRFEITGILPYKPGKLPFRKANVSSRNFPESVEKIRKRNRIKDGGATYLFFVRCMDESLYVLETQPA